jgi:hypothetical protein
VAAVAASTVPAAQALVQVDLAVAAMAAIEMVQVNLVQHNTGGGGGGGSDGAGFTNGRAGGSGVVIVSYQIF